MTSPLSQSSAARGAYPSARARLHANIPLREQRLQCAGVSTAVLEGGDGPPMVLLHGAGEFAAVWMRVIPALNKTYRLVVPELPGHGESGIGEGPMDVARISEWLADLIRQTCASAPVLVGHLLGGVIALRYALDNRSKVSCLVLVDSYGLAPFRPSVSFALALIAFMVRPNMRSQNRVFRGCFADFDALRENVGAQWEAIAEYALDCARKAENKIVMRTLMPKLAIPAIPTEQLARNTVPTTLIWGRHDLQVQLHVAQKASARHRWPLHVIENAGDDPAYEQPEAFLRALRSALAAPEPHGRVRHEPAAAASSAGLGTPA
ncbi:MAG: alpha/beta fold hydrolase [Gemmatimonadaceae bacterium]